MLAPRPNCEPLRSVKSYIFIRSPPIPEGYIARENANAVFGNRESNYGICALRSNFRRRGSRGFARRAAAGCEFARAPTESFGAARDRCIARGKCPLAARIGGHGSARG